MGNFWLKQSDSFKFKLVLLNDDDLSLSVVVPSPLNTTPSHLSIIDLTFVALRRKRRYKVTRVGYGRNIQATTVFIVTSFCRD